MATTQEKIIKVMEAKVTPLLASHGGDVAFVSFDDASGTLYVNLVGACGTCPYAQETMRMAVESIIMQEIPEVTSVVRV